MKSVIVLAFLCLCHAQFGDNSGIGAGMMQGVTSIGNSNKNNNNNNEPVFFHDGRDGDIRSLWSFGVNGFFIPPPDFADLPFLAANGTIIPTSAVGLICFDGVGGCSIELTAVVGGNLGRQVFNVSMNKVRFISNLCRVRVSRLGRVIITAKLSEVSTRLLPMSSLSVPIVIVAQLSSRQFAFIEFDQMFVMQGEAVRIRRFDNFLNDHNNNNGGSKGGQDGMGGPGSGGPSAGGPGGPSAGGGVWGGVMGVGMSGNIGHDNNRNNNMNMCPNLLDDSVISDGTNAGMGSGGYGDGSYDGW